MITLELSTKKVSSKTLKEVAEFVYSNRENLSDDVKMYYQSVKGFIDRELKKPVLQRMQMNDILERAYNIEQYILNAGTVSYEVEFVK